MSTKDAIAIMRIDDGVTICRLCADVSPSKTYTPLYTRNREEHIITKQINQLVSDLISPNDGLPQQACFKCTQSVSKCFKFITNVIETQHKLRQMIEMPDVDEKNHSSPSPNQFLENDQSACETDLDIGLRTLNNYKSKRKRTEKDVNRLNSTTKALSEKVESHNESSARAINVADAYMKRLKSCAFKSLSTDVNENNDAPTPRVFRCGICYSKFAMKEACLQHIVDHHSEVRKPVQPTTIFETIRKTDVNSIMASSTGHTNNSNTVSVTASVAKVVTTSASASSHNDHEYSREIRSTRSQTQEQSKSTPKTPTKRNRKVLNIDTFYVQVNKRCTKYICDNCGRMMMSRFAFLRHLHDHEKVPPSESSVRQNEAQQQVTKKSSIRIAKYCRICKKTVNDGTRHRMYHTIMKLESKYPNSAKKLSKL